VTIAREVTLECPFEELGAKVLREASIKTNAEAGDGTTTSIVLAEQILKLASRRVALGESPVFIKEGLLAAADFVIAQVQKGAKPVETNQQRASVAINSCANAADGTMVAEAVTRVGADGIITIEENNSGATTLTFVDGLEIDAGLAGPYFCEDPESLSTTFENAKVRILDQKLMSLREILPFLESAVQEKFPLVLIADDYSPDVIQALVLNKVRAGLRVCALKCGIPGDRRDAILGDIAALADGTCDKVIMSMDNSKFISKPTAKLQERIKLVRAQLAAADDEYNKVRLGERLARLTNGVAVISVGCATQIEQKEKRLRIEDAVAATRAACQEGVVVGGGLALLRTKKVLTKHIKTMPQSRKCGAEILFEALDAPFRQICVNSGVNPDLVMTRLGSKCGFDARTRRYVDMFTAGIVDPAKVVKTALKNAASVAATLLTTEGVVLK
jgi:chaperonin GroEL